MFLHIFFLINLISMMIYEIYNMLSGIFLHLSKEVNVQKFSLQKCEKILCDILQGKASYDMECLESYPSGILENH